MPSRQYIVAFEDLIARDAARAGVKNTVLGNLWRQTHLQGVRFPPGFVLTTDAYRAFADHNGLPRVIQNAVAAIGRDRSHPSAAALTIRSAFERSTFPDDLREQLLRAYRRLWERNGEDVAVRVSATEKDFPESDAAGGARLHVVGESALLSAVRDRFASLYTEAAIRAREASGIDQLTPGVALGIQRMVRSDLGCAGTLSWGEEETGYAETVLISAAWGLGGGIVEGGIEPDEYRVRIRLGSERDLAPVITRRRGAKLFKVIYDAEAGEQRCVPATADERNADTLDDQDLVKLAQWAAIIERACPMVAEVEWAKDGRSGEIFVIESRSQTLAARMQATADAVTLA